MISVTDDSGTLYLTEQGDWHVYAAQLPLRTVCRLTRPFDSRIKIHLEQRPDFATCDMLGVGDPLWIPLVFTTQLELPIEREFDTAFLNGRFSGI